MSEKGTDVTVLPDPGVLLTPPVPSGEVVSGTGVKRQIYEALILSQSHRPPPWPEQGKPRSPDPDIFGQSAGLLSEEEVYGLIKLIAPYRLRSLQATADLANRLVSDLHVVKESAQMTDDADVSVFQASFTTYANWSTSGQHNSNTAVFSRAADGITCLQAGRYLCSFSIVIDGDTANQIVAAKFAVGGVEQNQYCVGHILASATNDRGQLSLVAVLEVTANQKISVKTARLGAGVGACVSVGGAGYLSVVEL